MHSHFYDLRMNDVLFVPEEQLENFIARHCPTLKSEIFMFRSPRLISNGDKYQVCQLTSSCTKSNSKLSLSPFIHFISLFYNFPHKFALVVIPKQYTMPLLNISFKDLFNNVYLSMLFFQWWISLNYRFPSVSYFTKMMNVRTRMWSATSIFLQMASEFSLARVTDSYHFTRSMRSAILCISNVNMMCYVTDATLSLPRGAVNYFQ